MAPLDQALSLTTALLAALALLGLVRRGRVRACRAFAAYLATATLGHLLLATAPQRFWTWQFLTATDLVQALLLCAIVAEITHKTFRPLPVGYRRARRVLSALALGAMGVVAVSGRDVDSPAQFSLLLERASYGLGFLFLGFMVVVRWHAIPVDPLHRSIATGFAFVTMLVGCVSALASVDPVPALGPHFIVKTAYPCVLAWWAHNAWRVDDFGRLSPEAVRRLHPWRLP
jgi:hypothetical protein